MTTVPPAEPADRATPVVRSLLFLVACPLLLVLATALVQPVALGQQAEVGAIASILTYGLTRLFLRWDGAAPRAIGLEATRRTAPRLLVGCAIGGALVALQAGFVYAGGHVRWAPSPAAPTASRLGIAASAYLLLALREEIAFRAYPLRRLECSLGMWPALLIVGTAFSLEHAAGGWSWSRSLLGPPAAALLFGVAALATRGIAVPLGIHFAFNLGQWMLGQKEIPGLWQPVIDPAFQAQAETLGYAGYYAGTLAAAFGFWPLLRRRTQGPGA